VKAASILTPWRTVDRALDPATGAPHYEALHASEADARAYLAALPAGRGKRRLQDVRGVESDHALVQVLRGHRLVEQDHLVDHVGDRPVRDGGEFASDGQVTDVLRGRLGHGLIVPLDATRRGC